MKKFLLQLKEKIKQKSFWLAIVGAVVLLLQVVGIKVDAPYVNQIINAVCAVFILLGVMTDAKPAPQTKGDSANILNSDKSQNNPNEVNNTNQDAKKPL